MRNTAALLLAFATSCTGGVPEWCVAPDGAELRIAGEPTAWSATPALRTVWRIDGSAPGRELLTPVSAAISDDARRIAIVDFNLHEVIVIGLDGEWIGRWGRAGAGPGEFRAPYAAAWRRDGRLLVYDPAGSKLVVFDSTGATLNDVPVDPAFTAALGGGARSIRLDGSGMLLAESGPAFRGEGSSRMHVVVRGGTVGRDIVETADIAGVRVDTLLRSIVPVVLVPGAAPITAPGWPVPLGAIHGDSILALAGDSPRYLVRIYRNGRLSHVICRDVDPLPSTDAETDPIDPDVPDPVTAAMAGAPRPPSPASFGRLAIDADRRLWVQRDRARALSGLDHVIGRPGARFDVFDNDGHYLGEVRMPANVRFLAATRDLIIGLEASELDELSVVALQFDAGDHPGGVAPQFDAGDRPGGVAPQ